MKTENFAETQARAQVESICAMVAALDCDYYRLDELRELAKTPRFVAGWNIPGYMPDNMFHDFDDVDAARQYIIEAVKRFEDETDTESEAETLCAFAEDLNLMRGVTFSEQCGAYVYWVSEDGFMPLPEDDAAELAELEDAAGDCENEDAAREAIQDDPLSIEVRSGWYAPGEESETEEFRIVLCTGGPHVEIVGELGAYNVPERVRVLYRDWGTSGELFDFDRDAVLTYCQQFYFGE